jgi:hypothetical protein
LNILLSRCGFRALNPHDLGCAPLGPVGNIGLEADYEKAMA